jgi:hypothetical protein
LLLSDRILLPIVCSLFLIAQGDPIRVVICSKVAIGSVW